MFPKRPDVTSCCQGTWRAPLLEAGGARRRSLVPISPAIKRKERRQLRFLSRQCDRLDTELKVIYEVEIFYLHHSVALPFKQTTVTEMTKQH